MQLCLRFYLTNEDKVKSNILMGGYYSAAERMLESLNGTEGGLGEIELPTTELQ